MPTMDDRAIEEYAAFACYLADLAGRTILPYFRVRLAVENKARGGYDPVTLADRAAERAIRDEIHRIDPGLYDHGTVHRANAHGPRSVGRHKDHGYAASLIRVFTPRRIDQYYERAGTRFAPTRF
jgi:hypothetical protein